MLHKVRATFATITAKKTLLIGTVLISIAIIAGGIYFILPQNPKNIIDANENISLNGKSSDAGGLEVEPNANGAEEFPENETSALTSKSAEKAALQKTANDKNPSDTSQNFNILILGIDRRSGGETSWRTDVIQLITLNSARSKAVITHFPRDIWSDAYSYKINAVYNLKGPDAIKDEIKKISGQRPDRIIRIDFDAFVWAVDAVGGLTINVPREFTDSGYPNDRKGSGEVITVNFEAGEQTMDGETALIYARSRKGTNGEGS